MAASTVPITGDTGRITVEGVSLVQFFSWTINPKAEVKTTRAYDAVLGWEESTEATLKMWDGSCEANFVQSQYDSLFLQLGLKVAAEFITQTVGAVEYGYFGDIIITELPLKHQVGEIVTATLSFKGTGPLAKIAVV